MRQIAQDNYTACQWEITWLRFNVQLSLIEFEFESKMHVSTYARPNAKANVGVHVPKKSVSIKRIKERYRD